MILLIAFIAIVAWGAADAFFQCRREERRQHTPVRHTDGRRLK